MAAALVLTCVSCSNFELHFDASHFHNGSTSTARITEIEKREGKRISFIKKRKMNKLEHERGKKLTVACRISIIVGDFCSFEKFMCQGSLL